MEFTLYHYWRSSSSWRVRLALEHKDLHVNYVPVDLLNGESESSEHLKRNPLGYVPALEIKNGTEIHTLIESMAIIEFLDEINPERKLIYGNSFQKAQIRALCEIINADTQPIQNVPVFEYYSNDPQKRKEWIQHFVGRGLDAFEKQLKDLSGKYCVGDEVSAADFLLVPQCYNAIRYEMDLRKYPKIFKIHENLNTLDVVKQTHPDKFKPEK